LATYVVGDIQGCYQPLRRLLAEVDFHSGRDELWSVGDLVNRGPHSLETLRFLYRLGSAFTGVLGNHDLHFLAVHSKAKTDGKTKTLQPLLDAPDCQLLFEWVRQLPLALQQSVATEAGIRQVLIVHAGLAPGWDAATALELGEEVATALRSKGFVGLLRGMYGDLPDRWDAALTGIERLRVITNVLTRMRFCTPAGKMDLTVKTEADTAPPGFQPWFDFIQPAPEELLLFGHWATLDGVTRRTNIIGLDTGCVWGRRMSLLHLEKHELISITCHDC
jgi:bis(5'-nucleosyl)-tetraphosphatase (symmetrical)